MGRAIRTIDEVVERQLCSGCGVCAYLEPKRFHMGNALEYGRRPFVNPEAPQEAGDAVRACPGLRLEHDFDPDDPQYVGELIPGWGPIVDVWEGAAADEEICHAGSSGGALTALSLYCVEVMEMAGVLHTVASDDHRYLNETRLSTNREELMAGSGSRYAPASPGDGLSAIENAEKSCLFVGKPCDVAGVQQARKLRASLDENIGATIAFFCAGSPSTKGTLELLRKVGVENPDSVTGLRYRGNGWPGMWTVESVDEHGTAQVSQLTYAESWDFLQRYRQWRCYICPDHTGEFADIAVGDPWYREIGPDERGSSLIIARTQKGKKIIEDAAAAGYLRLTANDPSLLPRSQPNLLATRGSIWARLNVLRLLGAATPTYTGFKIFRFWCSELSTKSKLQSFIGTAKRVFVKRLNRSIVYREWFPKQKVVEK